jgi:hypothetical protein
VGGSPIRLAERAAIFTSSLGSEIRVSEIRVSEIRVPEIRVSVEIRVS